MNNSAIKKVKHNGLFRQAIHLLRKLSPAVMKA